MKTKKQILVLEDLGIPRNLFENLFQQTNDSLEVIWNKEDAIPDSVEFIVTIKTKVQSSLLEVYPNTKVIAVAFTGYDCVDLDICDKKGIVAYNVPEYSTNSVAELVLGLAISLLREIPQSRDILLNGGWSYPPGKDLKGKTIGILGTGKIGTLTAKLFKAFGCNIIGWSRTENEKFREIGKYASNIKDLCSSSDIVSIHLPQTKDTIGIIGVEELSAMKDSAYIINTARGPIIEERALINALQKKEISGAALDVFSQEPLPANSPFLNLKNAILIPHIAYKTEEALQRRARVTAENILNFPSGGEKNRIN